MMGFIFVRDRGFHECTPWPVQGWDMMMVSAFFYGFCAMF